MHDDKAGIGGLRAADWYKSATRWTQLTLAEDDPVKYDPAFWIDMFKRTQSNATCLSAGGYVAYYPSKVQHHYVSKFIGDTDPFGTLVDGARQLGLHVMARVDPHAIHQDAADAHPEWVAVDKEGRPRSHWAFPDAWVTCAYSDYNFKFMPQVIAEITERYDIDAIFANRWQGNGVCYCENCQRNFRAASGYELPLAANPEDPVWMAWAAWRRTLLSQLVVQWDQVVKAIRPNASFIPNMGGASLMEFDLKLIEEHCPFLVVDAQSRKGTEPIWMSGRNGKRMRATFRDRPVVLIASIGPEEVHRWKDSVTPGPETEAWLSNGIAHGMLPWFTKFNGVVPDERWVQPVVSAFERHAQMEPVMASMTPFAEIALLDPATSLRHHEGESRHQAETDDLGFYQALVEARLPFEMLSDHAMTPALLDRFKVVILANATCLSDAQCRMLSGYVARGGSIVAANQTSTRTEDNRLRDDFGLGAVLGVSMTSPARGPLKNTYLALNGTHPIAEGFEGALRIIGGTYLTAVEATSDAVLPLLYIPDFPDLPMEEVYQREAPRGGAVIAREHAGGGRTVFMPWNIGAIFWDVLTPDHGRLIANAVRWALGARPAVEISGQAVLDIALRQSDTAMAIALHNLTNPMMMKGPLREIYPVGRQEVSVAVPKGKRFASARLLLADEAAAVQVDGERVIVTVPGIAVLEVIHITWAAA